MNSEGRAESEDNIYHDSDDPDTATNVKVKTKRPGVLGKLKDRIFGHKKRRTRSHDSASGKDGDCTAGSYKAMSTNQLAADSSGRLGNSTFAPAEGHNLPQSGMIGMKNTSASLEALTSSSKLKSELERKLVNRRSLDDDGLPGSPVGTPTADIMSHSDFIKNNIRKGQDFHRSDRDSDGSLLSIGSSENEEDAFFKNPWKGAYTSAIRRPRHGTLSSDSEPEDALDFDVVGKTSNLSNAAAMHKRNVRPRHRNKTRRVTAATGQMPSLAEKKTLEIAHTFLDEGETSAIKLRSLDAAIPSVTVRRTDSGRAYSSPAVQRKSDPNVMSSKSPKPVARSSTTAASTSNKSHTTEEPQAHELFSVLQRLKPQPLSTADIAQNPPEAKASATIALGPGPAIVDEDQQTKAPARPPKNVGFTGTPPLERRAKAPAVQSRPKSMHPQQVRSKTQEIQGSSVEEAISHLSYSKSFNNHEANTSSDSMLRSQATNGGAEDTSLPEWTKLAKRKTWAVTLADDSSSETLNTAPKPASKPTPAARQVQRQQQSADLSTELEKRLSQTNLPGASSDTPKSTTVPDKERTPLLYSPRIQPVASERVAGMSSGRKSQYDNVTIAQSSDRNSAGEETKMKESIILPKLKPTVLPPGTTSTSGGGDSSPPLAQPPWKASLKQRAGSLKSTPTTATENGTPNFTPATQQKPAWKSATLRERTTPSSLMSTSSDGLNEMAAGRNKNNTLDTPARNVNRMTVSETSAYTAESPQEELSAGEEPKSFRDRLKMFQSQ